MGILKSVVEQTHELMQSEHHLTSRNSWQGKEFFLVLSGGSQMSSYDEHAQLENCSTSVFVKCLCLSSGF